MRIEHRKNFGEIINIGLPNKTESEAQNKEANQTLKSAIRSKIFLPSKPDSQESLLQQDGTPSCGLLMSPKFAHNAKKKDKSLIFVDKNKDLHVKRGGKSNTRIKPINFVSRLDKEWKEACLDVSTNLIESDLTGSSKSIDRKHAYLSEQRRAATYRLSFQQRPEILIPKPLLMPDNLIVTALATSRSAERKSSPRTKLSSPRLEETHEVRRSL